MTWLAIIRSRFAQAGAAILVFLGWLTVNNRKQRKMGAQGVKKYEKE